MALGCATWPAAGIGGCAAAAPGVAAGAGAPAALTCCAGRGMILSVSRRISFTFCTIDSQRLFWALRSIVETAPVVPGAAVCAAPNCVEAVEVIFTLRAALR